MERKLISNYQILAKVTLVPVFILVCIGCIAAAHEEGIKFMAVWLFLMIVLVASSIYFVFSAIHPVYFDINFLYLGKRKIPYADIVKFSISLSKGSSIVYLKYYDENRLLKKCHFNLKSSWWTNRAPALHDLDEFAKLKNPKFEIQGFF